MGNFTNKNILLFIPNGRGNYGTAFEKKLKELGANVIIFDERPSKSNISKALNRIASKQLEFFNKKYFSKIIKQLPEIHFDFVLVIRGEVFTSAILELLKSRITADRYILYLWDSLKNNDKREVFKYFDKIFSFDRADCIKFNIRFRPLFFTDLYDYQKTNFSKDLDLLFIGTLHTNRYCFFKEVNSYFDKLNLKTFNYFFLQSRLLFYRLKLQNKCMKNARIKDVNFTPLSMEIVAKLMLRSKVSLDLQHKSQAGLTMRTIEALGARTKLITTNEDIRNYDFYDSRNIYILNNNLDNLNESFFMEDFMPINDEIIHNYTLHGWLDEVFNFEEM